VRVLVVNAGSSSLKLSVLDGDELVWSGSELGDVGGVDAVGHRIVHGGTEFVDSVVIDDLVVRRLRSLTDLAPLHQPKSLDALELVSRALPDVPAVACFDTAFHARIPAAAATYALPREWRERWSLRRFGFHGLSHHYASRRAAELAGRPVEGFRVVTCHLGAGASLAAVRDGVSVDTTMGFTPLEGLVMATRSGSVDAGLVLWLEEHAGIAPSELASTLEHGSGLLGLAGSAEGRPGGGGGRRRAGRARGRGLPPPTACRDRVDGGGHGRPGLDRLHGRGRRALRSHPCTGRGRPRVSRNLGRRGAEQAVA
jgi:acetate kinase